MADHTYAASEVRSLLKRGPSEGEDFYRMKLTGNGETRWVNVTPAQVAAIESILDDTPRFYTHDINDGNVDDLQREIDALRKHKGRLVGVVDEEDGGIIAYAVTEEYAARIVDGLTSNGLDPSTTASVRDALEGDSNDAEHDALIAVADALGITYTIPED